MLRYRDTIFDANPSLRRTYETAASWSNFGAGEGQPETCGRNGRNDLLQIEFAAGSKPA
jgi:hypothetical protein